MERARKAERASTPRKHHIVPESYLRRWAENGQIRVTEIDGCRTYLTSSKRAAKITDYYRVESDDIDPELVPPLLFEVFFSDVERAGKESIDVLLGLSGATLDADSRSSLARYIALQCTRGQSYRSQSRKLANDIFRLQYDGMTEDGIRALLSRRGMEWDEDVVREIRQQVEEVENGTLFVSPQDAAVVGEAVRSAEWMAEYLYVRDWVVYRTPPVLLTCDEPVILIGGPGQPRAERPGVATAGVVIFPLAPDAVLVMFRRDLAPSGAHELDHAETAEVNLEILANSSRWAFERPSRNMARHRRVPQVAAPTEIERIGLEPDTDNELIRTYRPNRWANAELQPDWPVARGWR